jgi:plastocyanin
MTMRRTIATIALAGVLTLGAAAPAAAVVIRGNGTRWRPSSVDIARGDRVRWRAALGTHTVRAFGGNWTYFRTINQGESVARRFRTRGTFRFFCTIHGDVAAGRCTGMCGRVLV